MFSAIAFSLASLGLSPTLSGEFTVQEVATALQSALHASLSVDPDLKERLVYLDLQSQDAATALKGFCFSLGVVAEPLPKDKGWLIKEVPAKNYPAADLVNTAIKEALSRYLKADGLSKEQYIDAAGKLAKEAKEAKSNRDVEAYKRLVGEYRFARGAGDWKVILHYLATMPDPGAVSASRLGLNSLATLPLDFDPDLSPLIASGGRAAGHPSSSSEDPIGTPFVIVMPRDCDENACRWVLRAVYANRVVALEDFGVRLAVSPGPALVNNVDKELLHKPIEEPKRLYGSQLASTDILPPIARKLGLSMATWCEPEAPSWRWPIIGRVSLSKLISQARGPWLPSEKIAFEREGDWLKLSYPQFKKPEPRIPWNSLLPWIRKARAGKLSITELRKIYFALPDSTLDAMNEVRIERPLLTNSDIALVDNAYLLRCFFELGTDALNQALKGEFRCTIADMPQNAAADALSYLKSPRGWPTKLYCLHPDFPSVAAGYQFVAEYKKVARQNILKIGLAKYQVDGGNFGIAVSGP